MVVLMTGVACGVGSHVLAQFGFPNAVGTAVAKDGGNSGEGGGDNSGEGGGDHSGKGGDDQGDDDRNANDGGKAANSGSGKLRKNGSVSWSRFDRGRMAVRYTDGWTEAVTEGRYRLTDRLNRVVVDRPARPGDSIRLRAAAQGN